MPAWCASGYGIAVVAALVALPAAADAAPGTLDLRQSIDRSRGIYVEGAVSYVRVRGVRGRLVVAKRVRRPRFRMQRRLAPGLYRVISYQRPCDGNCGTLDPPTDRCARRVRILSGGLTEVAVTGPPGPPLHGWAATRCRRASRRCAACARSSAGCARGGATNSWALIDSLGTHARGSRRSACT